MKNVFTITAFIFLITEFLACSNPTSNSTTNQFAIYLLKDNHLSTKDVQDQNISTLKLASKPLIQYDDIQTYNFLTHKISFKKEFSFSSYFGSDTLTIFSKYFGTPFVVIANDERIYLGSFHSSVSSWLPHTPIVLDLSLFRSSKSISMSIAYFQNTSEVDIRNDHRIKKALKNKIIESSGQE